MREAEEKERERKRREEEAAARREREEKERKEKEERARKEQQEREREREQREQRERERERERREKERRELERIERERMLEQQRLSQSSKMQRERSPLRNGTDSDGARIKEEPKREADEMMMRGPPSVVPDPRYAAAHAQHMAAAQHYNQLVGRHMMPGQLPPVSLLFFRSRIFSLSFDNLTIKISFSFTH